MLYTIYSELNNFKMKLKLWIFVTVLLVSFLFLFNIYLNIKKETDKYDDVFFDTGIDVGVGGEWAGDIREDGIILVQGKSMDDNDVQNIYKYIVKERKSVILLKNAKFICEGFSGFNQIALDQHNRIKYDIQSDLSIVSSSNFKLDTLCYPENYVKYLEINPTFRTSPLIAGKVFLAYSSTFPKRVWAVDSHKNETSLQGDTEIYYSVGAGVYSDKLKSYLFFRGNDLPNYLYPTHGYSLDKNNMQDIKAPFSFIGNSENYLKLGENFIFIPWKKGYLIYVLNFNNLKLDPGFYYYKGQSSVTANENLDHLYIEATSLTKLMGLHGAVGDAFIKLSKDNCIVGVPVYKNKIKNIFNAMDAIKSRHLYVGNLCAVLKERE